MVPKRQSRPRINKCVSCRRLKIKCDESKPICEYCEHTNRQCIYESEEDSPSSDSSTSSEAVMWRKQNQLNALPNHLGITTFEYQLLRYFHQVIVPNKIDDIAIRQLWQVHVPQLFQGSPLVRNSMLSLSAVSVGGLCDLSSWAEISEVDEDARSMAITAMNEVPNSKQHLLDMTDQYYMQTIKDMGVVMADILSGRRVLTTIQEAAEITFAGSMLFTFLALQSNNLIPLFSFDPSEPDLISICQGVKETLLMCYPMLIDSSFSAFFKSKEMESMPEVAPVFPFVDHLRQCGKQMNVVGMISDSELTHYLHSLETLDILFSIAAEHNSSIIIYRWLFIIDNEVYNYIRQDQSFLGLKMLYAYSCLNIFCKFYTSRKRNLWLDYIEWYKDYNMAHGGWNDDFDRKLYDLVHSDFLFNNGDYAVLYTFLP